MKQKLPNNHHKSEQRKSNIGVLMTILYAIIYSGFVVLSVFFPTLMGNESLFGLNLAIAYGLALIIVAIIFAIIYNALVRIPNATKWLQEKQDSGRNQSEN
jgi:uncharacterized membrane protein (DUF485 family)